MTTTTDRRMLHTDAFAWYMERDPVLRSTVVAVGLLDRPPDWDYLQRRVEWLTTQVGGLRERVQEPPWRLGPPRWVPDAGFDLGYHLRRVRVPEPGGDWSAVLEVARVAAMADFDRARPLWEFTLLEGLPENRAAIVTKIHHAVADGIGGIQIAGLLVDPGRKMPPVPSWEPAPAPPPLGAVALVARSVRDNVAEAVTVGARVAGGLVPAGAHALRHPVGDTTYGLRLVRSVGRLCAPVLSTASPVMTARTAIRHLDTFDVPLVALRDAAHNAGGRLNDAMLTAVTGGLRRYHERHGQQVHDLRVLMPVSIRRPDDPPGGNRLTLLRFLLPVGEPDPVTRLHEVSRTSQSWQHEPAIPYTQGISFALNLAPSPAIQSMLRRVDFLVSDVPGLPSPVYLAGAKLLRYYPFGPTIGTAVNVTVMSYVDSCCVGVNVDLAAVPDPDLLLADLRDGFEEVLLAGRRRKPAGGWGGPPAA